LLYSRKKTTKPSAADVILLFSGDGDFLPIIRRVRAWGKDVRIIGVKNKIHQLLHPYCESFDVFCTLLKRRSSDYSPSDDLVRGIQLIAEMQIKLPYVASTRARLALSKKLERTTSEIKGYIQYLLSENYLLEKEAYDSNLVIKKTKIYLLNLANPTIQNIVVDWIEQLKIRYSRLDYIMRGEEEVQDNDR